MYTVEILAKRIVNADKKEETILDQSNAQTLNKIKKVTWHKSSGSNMTGIMTRTITVYIFCKMYTTSMKRSTKPFVNYYVYRKQYKKKKRGYTTTNLKCMGKT